MKKECILVFLCIFCRVYSDSKLVSKEIINPLVMSEQTFLLEAKKSMKGEKNNLNVDIVELQELNLFNEYEEVKRGLSASKSIMAKLVNDIGENRVVLSMTIFNSAEAAYKRLWTSTMSPNLLSRAVDKFSFSSNLVSYTNGNDKSLCIQNILVIIKSNYGYKTDTMIEEVHRLICEANDLVYEFISDVVAYGNNATQKDLKSTESEEFNLNNRIESSSVSSNLPVTESDTKPQQIDKKQDGNLIVSNHSSWHWIVILLITFAFCILWIMKQNNQKD
jgi:hypothetical protein